MKYQHLKIDSVSFWSPHERNKGGMRMHWSGDMGFGTLDIVKRAGSDYELDGMYEEIKLEAYTEHMDIQEEKLFIKKIIGLLVEELIVMD